MAQVIMSSTALVVIAVLLVFPSRILAGEYVVGEDLVWDGAADYQAWADSIIWQLNDALREWFLFSLLRIDFEFPLSIYTFVRSMAHYI